MRFFYFNLISVLLISTLAYSQEIKLRIKTRDSRALHIESVENLSYLYNVKNSKKIYYSGIVRVGNAVSKIAIVKEGKNLIIDIGKLGYTKKFQNIIVKNNKIKFKKGILNKNVICKTLSNDNLSNSLNTFKAATSQPATTVKVIDLSVDGDSFWKTTYGISGGKTKITEIVNSANAIYLSDLGIKISLIRAEVFTSLNFSGTTDPNDPEEILPNFGNYVLGNLSNYTNVDVAHMFTTRNFTGATIGLAYIGEICRDYPFGIIQDLNTLTPVIFAHELGHNFGADHDDTPARCSAENGIMRPSLGSPAPTTFSSCSKTAIANHIAVYNSCLSNETIDSSPTPTSTPTPNNPGNGGNNPGTPIATPSITFKVTQTGSLLNISTSPLNTEAAGCSYSIYIRETKSSKYKISTIASGTNLQKLLIKGTLPGRFKDHNKKFNLSASISLRCSSGNYITTPVNFNTLKAKSKSILTFSSWISKFKKTIKKS